MISLDHEQTTYVDILRHGECEGGRIFRGLTDVSLTPAGFNNMQTVCAHAQRDWDVIISSPLKRCRHFAEHLSAQKGIELSIDAHLREIHFGEWDGKELDAIWQHDYDRISAWIKDPVSTTPPGGEALGAVQQRISAVYLRIIEEFKGKKILMVAHGGVIRVLLGYVLQMPLSAVNSLDVPYACLSRFAVFHHAYGEQTTLQAHNYQQHAALISSSAVTRE